MKFKISHLILSTFFIIALSSCSSDDTPSGGNQAEIAEQTPIASQKVLDNLIVDGGTKKTGAPDAPNEAISFTLNKENTSAVMVDGFNIELSSNNTVAGIYLQIKDVDGGIADGYYDIPVSTVGFKNTVIAQKTKRGLKPKITTSKANVIDDDISVDVDFTNIIEPGTFCYVVCIYDAEGNISAPEEVCVTVESWGGNDNLLGLWNYTKTEEYYDGSMEVFNVGETDCYNGTIICNNQEQLSYTECYTDNYIKLTLEQDGTFVLEFSADDEEIDYDASQNSCQEVKESYEEVDISKGNWAYSDQSGKLLLVQTENTETINGESNGTDFYDVGEAFIIEFKVNLNGNSLVLVEEYFDSNNILEEYYKYYFDKQ